MASYYRICDEVHKWMDLQEAHETATTSALRSLDPLENQQLIISDLSRHWHAFRDEEANQRHVHATQHLLFMATGVRIASRTAAIIGTRDLESRTILHKSISELAYTINTTRPEVIRPSVIIQVYGDTLKAERFFPGDDSELARKVGYSAIEVLLEHAHRAQRPHEPNNIVIPRPGVAEGVIEPWIPRAVSANAY